MIRIGTAGWGIPRDSVSAVGAEGTHLQRYASAMDCVEINSSFYRSHRQQTYERWGTDTPAGFRFAVKTPRALTHDARLQCSDDSILAAFLDEISGLKTKLGVLLLQMPRSLEFDAAITRAFLSLLRERWSGPVVCEPRHSSWFSRPADRLIDALDIGRVAADPSCTPSAAYPRCAASAGLMYYRWHGSPRTYWSRYSTSSLERLAETLSAHPSASDVWCIFDNTASGSALSNALELKALLSGGALRNPGAHAAAMRAARRITSATRLAGEKFGGCR